MKTVAIRAKILDSYGISATVIDELLAYNTALLEPTAEPLPPLPSFSPEPHIAIWQNYVLEAQERGCVPLLRQKLWQLQFPIQAGISQTAVYQKGVRGELEPTAIQEAFPLEAAQLQVYESFAGPIPTILLPLRADFVRFIQALVYHNEPFELPASIGAFLITRYVNQERRALLQQKWQAEMGVAATAVRLWLEPEAYQDRFIVLSDGPYSHIPALALDLSVPDWHELSAKIRLNHEVVHYLAWRWGASLRHHPLDELIADYGGLLAANGRYDASWAALFMGFEGGEIGNGRLAYYQPQLSPAAFAVLHQLLQKAANNLQALSEQYPIPHLPQHLSHLFRLSLEEISHFSTLNQHALS